MTLYTHQFIPQILIKYLQYVKNSASRWRHQSEQNSDLITLTAQQTKTMKGQQ